MENKGAPPPTPPKPDFVALLGPFRPTAHVYETGAMLEDARKGTVTVYDRADFPTLIERAKIQIKSSQKSSGYNITGTIQLDRSRTDLKAAMDRIQDNLHLIASHPNPREGEFTIKPTIYPNVHIFEHTDGGRFLIWINQDSNIITVTNELYLERKDTDSNIKDSTEIIAPDAGTINYRKSIGIFAAAYATMLDKTTSASQPSHQKGQLIGKSLDKILHIGSERTLVPLDMTHQNTPESTKKNVSETDAETQTSQQETEETEAPVKFEDIGGYTEIKEQLKDIALAFKNGDIMKKWGAKKPLGVLLYGPPGNGKTMMVEALATEIGGSFVKVKSSEIFGDAHLGTAVKYIDHLFDSAIEKSKSQPMVLFFDEFESIINVPAGPDTGGGATAERAAVAGLFKQRMTQLANSKDCNILVVGATNDVDSINETMIRSGRFDEKIFVPMPDEHGRKEIVINFLSKGMALHLDDGFKMFDDAVKPDEIATLTDGLSGADIAEIFRRIQLAKAMQEARGEEATPITMDDFQRHIRKFRTQ